MQYHKQLYHHRPDAELFSTLEEAVQAMDEAPDCMSCRVVQA